MKINPRTKCKEQETPILSWETLMGKKTQQLLQYRFNIERLQCQYNAGESNPRCQEPKSQTLATKCASHECQTLIKEEPPRKCATCQELSQECVMSEWPNEGASLSFYMVHHLQIINKLIYYLIHCLGRPGRFDHIIILIMPGRPLNDPYGNHLADLTLEEVPLRADLSFQGL